MDPNQTIPAVQSIFNGVAAYAAVGVAALAATALTVLKGPRQLRPENKTAKVITARNFPNIFKSSKLVARNGVQMYLGWGASGVSEVPLETYKVAVERKGKDESLVLKDKVKAEIVAEFYVRVDTSDTAADPNNPNIVAMTSDQKIIRALEALGGEINQNKIKDYCEPKFDAALRAAASEMTIEDVQSDREKFRDAVKKALDSLEKDGLELVDVSLRQMNQSPVKDFDPTNLLDAVGLQKVTKITEEARTDINNTQKQRDTERKERDKEADKQNFLIEQERTKAELAKNQEVERLKSEQERQVAEIRAEQEKQAKLAQFTAEQASEQARLQKEQQVAVATAQREQAEKVAQAQRDAAVQEAEVKKDKQIKLAQQDREIELNKKAELTAAAAKAAAEKRAEQVTAEQAVTTAQQVAEANRAKEVAVIDAQKTAEMNAAGKVIDAQAQLSVAKNLAEAAKTTAEGQAKALEIEAAAQAAAAKTRAEGAYAEQYQPLKAQADGKLADAQAEAELNRARNELSPEAREMIVNLERVKITPAVAETAMAAIANIDTFNVTSLNGFQGLGGLAQGGNGFVGAGGGSNDNIFEQAGNALLKYNFVKPLFQKFAVGLGGDGKIADFLPDLGTPEAAAPAAAPAPAAAAPAPSTTAADLASAAKELVSNVAPALAPVVAAAAQAAAPAVAAKVEQTVVQPRRNNGPNR